MNHKNRLRLVEKAARPAEVTLTAILPDYLSHIEQPKPRVTGKVIKPKKYLAYDETKDEVYFYES